MSFAIKYQLDLLGPSLKPGDVLLANSPVAGGSHLPDLTVITPVFASPSTSSSPDDAEGQQEIIFFTASRGHHADIGGAQPGSMPSYSTSLDQEGAEIISFKLVTGGKFDRDGLYKIMVDEPGKVEGCSGCRDFRSVESDIKAVSPPAATRSAGSSKVDAKIVNLVVGLVTGHFAANRSQFQGDPVAARPHRRVRPRDGPCVHEAYSRVSPYVPSAIASLALSPYRAREKTR